jgi:hypothetical protein
MDLVIEIVKAEAAILQPLVIFGLLCLAFILLNRHRDSLSETMTALGIKKVGIFGITAEFVEQRLVAAASAVEDRLPVRDEEKPEIRRITELLAPLASGARILWMDYFPSNNLYERDAFTHLGIDVQTRRTKDEAMAELRDPDEEYQLVISNWGQRERRQGPKFLTEIRSEGLTIPFLFYTGSDRLEEKRMEARTLGAQGVTASPVQLYRWVLTWLALR